MDTKLEMLMYKDLAMPARLQIQTHESDNVPQLHR